MRFTTREDIAVSADEVFEAISDFEAVEREVMRRGGDVSQVGDHSQKGEGQGWVIKFSHRGRARTLETEIERYEPNKAIHSKGRVGGLDGVLRFDLMSLSPQMTRLTVDLDMKPNTLSARLFIQSLKLTKNLLMKRFRTRVKYLGQRLEARKR